MAGWLGNIAECWWIYKVWMTEHFLYRLYIVACKYINAGFSGQEFWPVREIKNMSNKARDELIKV